MIVHLGPKYVVFDLVNRICWKFLYRIWIYRKLGGEIWEVRKLADNSLEIFKSYGMVMEII